jgi:hypothetical protein
MARSSPWAGGRLRARDCFGLDCRQATAARGCDNPRRPEPVGGIPTRKVEYETKMPTAADRANQGMVLSISASSAASDSSTRAMKHNKSPGFPGLAFAPVAAVATGSGGICASKSFSPLDFTLLGLLHDCPARLVLPLEINTVLLLHKPAMFRGRDNNAQPSKI